MYYSSFLGYKTLDSYKSKILYVLNFDFKDSKLLQRTDVECYE